LNYQGTHHGSGSDRKRKRGWERRILDADYYDNWQRAVEVAKALIRKGDFQFYKMIVQMAEQPAMETPFNPATMARHQKMQDTMKEWHSVGTEMINVPAGTFVCEHYKNDKNGSELWASDKVTPFGLVKQVGKDNSMVLVKVLSDVPDRITGPVRKFDPQVVMQQHQQQSQQPRP
jgi:hypothetical protein